MSITKHIDEALEKIQSTNPDWKGPHPDWSAFVISMMMEAAARDLVQAISDLSADLTRSINAVADSID